MSDKTKCGALKNSLIAVYDLKVAEGVIDANKPTVIKYRKKLDTIDETSDNIEEVTIPTPPWDT